MAEIDLAHLRYHWGGDDGAYVFSRRGRQWVAVRRDNGREVTAESGRELRDAVMADYTAEPVPRDTVPEPMGRQISDAAGEPQR
jgi:hypothetical protein